MSTRTKIAPRLREILEDIHGHPGFLRSDGPVCSAELRALLAVARLADRHTNPHEHCPACDPKLRAAVERLYRVSRGGR